MTIVERVQQYVIESRRQTRTATLVGPFTILLHSTSGDIESNVAIPRMPPSDAIEQGWHEALRAAFASQGRTPAIQWIADFAPHLASTLQTVGFSEYQRETLLVCTPETRPPTLAPVAGLTFVTVTDTSPLDEVQENLDVNEFGFDPAMAQPTTEEQAETFRATLQSARLFTARLHGRPASAGMYTAPVAGVTELVGIATLELYRGQGIAAALTAHMASSAFAQGCDLVFLWTANPAARRAYARAGFQPVGEVLTYTVSEASPLQHETADAAIGGK